MDSDLKPVQSAAMFVKRENTAYSYPMPAEPPVCQAQYREEAANGMRHLYLNYAGMDILTIRLDAGVPFRSRKGSDGCMQSRPLFQQFILSTERPVSATVTLHMRRDALCLRPRRAGEGEAILGQAGRPLIFGANGFYGIWEDMLLEWTGAEWSWNETVCRSLPDGSTAASFTVRLTPKPFAVLLRPRYYGDHLGYAFHRPWERLPNYQAVSGWCSWEAFHDKVTLEDMEQTAKQMSGLVPYGLRYMQLDDGYQTPLIPPEPNGKIYESWLRPNPKFPGGHEAIVQSVEKARLIPGIWTNATVTNEEAAGRNGLCLMENGTAVRGDWIQFILNITEKSLSEQILPIYRGLRTAGYHYFKVDAMRHLLYDGLQECVRRGLLSNEEVEKKYRAYYHCIRRGIGKDAYLLSCWGTLSQCVGIADACRVATDANPRWQAVQMQVVETARWFFAQRILFTLDPDHICARTEPEWARMLLSLVSLTGGVYMLSDPPECYDAARLQMIRKTLPAQEIFAAETGEVDFTHAAFPPTAGQISPEEYSRLTCGDHRGRDFFGTLWATHFAAGGRRWTVLLRAALAPLDRTDISLKNIGLDPSATYAVYDFWREEFLGIFHGGLQLPDLPFGHVQVLSVTPVFGPFTLVGSDRHVSMDHVSVRACRRAAGGIELELAGIPGDTCRYCFYTAGRKPTVRCDGGCAEMTENGRALWVAVRFEKERAKLTLE